MRNSEKNGGVEKMNFEDVFSSKPRMKILKLLSRLGNLNVSDIARRIKLNYTTTNQHLKVLENENILQQRVYGRIRMYRYQDSPKANAIQKLIEIWNQESY